MSQPFNSTSKHALILIVLQLLQIIFHIFVTLNGYHMNSETEWDFQMSESLRCYPQKQKTKKHANHKTSYSLMHTTGIINSLLTSSKIISAFVFGLFVQSADPCRLCGMTFLSEALKFLYLKTKLSPTDREFVANFANSGGIWESQQVSVSSSKNLKS